MPSCTEVAASSARPEDCHRRPPASSRRHNGRAPHSTHPWARYGIQAVLLCLLLLLAEPAAAYKRITLQQQPQGRGRRSHKQVVHTHKRTLGATECVLLRAPPHGLGSFLLNMLHSMVLLNPAGLPFYIDFSRSPFQCPVQQDTTTTTSSITSSSNSPTSSKAAASYATFFKGGAPLLPAPPFAGCDHRMTFLDAISRLGVERLQRADELGITYDQMEFGVGLNPTQVQQRSKAVQPFFEKLCAAVRKTWVLSDELQHIADYELSQLQLLPGPLVAVHIRGGDKLANGTTEIPPGYAYNFTAGMRRLVKAHPKAAGGSCVLLGDDATLLPVVATAARSVLRCKTVVSRLEPAYAHVQEEFNAQPVEQRCARTKKYLVDLDLLARADYSMGTVHSNVDLLAYQIRRCVVGKAGDTYVDLAGWSYEGYSPKLNAHMMPPHIMELFPEALEGHQDPGGTAVHVAGRDGNSSLALSSGVLDLRHVAEGEEEYGEEAGGQGVLGGLLRWLGFRGREQREEQY